MKRLVLASAVVIGATLLYTGFRIQRMPNQDWVGDPGNPKMLVIGDSFSARLQTTGEETYKQLLEKYQIRVDYRLEGVECGQQGGSLDAISQSTDCFEFEDVDVVVVLAGWHDIYWSQWGYSEPTDRAAGIGKIRGAWTKRAPEGATFHFADTWDWSRNELAEGTAEDQWGHSSAQGYEHAFACMGLL